MKKIKFLIVVASIIFIMAAPATVFADDDNDVIDYAPEAVMGNVILVAEPEYWDEWPAQPRLDEIFRTRDGTEPLYVRLRAFAEMEGAWDVRWNAETRVVHVVAGNGDFIAIAVEEEGGFIEDGVAWIPIAVAAELQQALRNAWWTPATPVERIDLTLWDRERFEEVREASFSTDLPHGEISLGFIEYMSDNLYARSPFTYRELETATWLVEELLAMGHDWDYIAAQEFTYWDLLELDQSGSGWGWLSWWLVTSPMLLGTDREEQIRLDRVSQNIILTLPGQSDSKIIVGAHYDSPPYPSASDNASGTALLLESAQRMMELDHYHTIVYVFFGAEEVGLIGANYYYQMLTEEERENIVLMINADVLIEGPYIIYGTGKFPTIDDDDVSELIEALVESVVESTKQWLDEECWCCELTGYEKFVADEMTRQEFIDMIIESEIRWLEMLPNQELAFMAVRLGLLEVYECEISEQINSIATELNRRYDFELLSRPEFALASSDHLIFIHEGYTVVNFAGMERAENVEALLKDHRGEYWLRLEHFGEGFSTTVLHSPLDDFHIIETIWPGMMLNNMRAFSIFLEQILTTRFY